jgi:hypothetical protein
VVTTGGAVGVTAGTATLQGTVNPCGIATTATFKYGLGTSYGSVKVVPLSPNNSWGSQNVSATIAGLTPRTTYHYTLTASNSEGTDSGVDATFTTP